MRVLSSSQGASGAPSAAPCFLSCKNGQFAPGGGWVLVGSAVFKTVVGREERPGCVRFAHASASIRLTAVQVGRYPSRGAHLRDVKRGIP